MANQDNAVNKATEDARAAGEIHEESQLNTADAGYVDNKGKERAPFDPHATPKGSVPNPADVAAAQRRRDAGESDEEIAEAMNVRPGVVAEWLGSANSGKKSTAKITSRKKKAARKKENATGAASAASESAAAPEQATA